MEQKTELEGEFGATGGVTSVMGQCENCVKAPDLT